MCLFDNRVTEAWKDASRKEMRNPECNGIVLDVDVYLLHVPP